MTAEVVQLDLATAKVITARIKDAVSHVAALPDLIARAYTGQVWKALGHASWDAYCTAELDTDRVKIPRGERSAIAGELRGHGLSVRAIAAATGSSIGTIHADLAGVQNRTPAVSPGRATRDDAAPPVAPSNVVGIDGKPYPAAIPASARPTKRGSLPDSYRSAVWDLERALRRLEKLHRDDRFARNRYALCGRHGAMLAQATDILAVLRAEIEGMGE